MANKRPQELSDIKGGNLLASKSDHWIKFLIRTNLIEFFLRRAESGEIHEDKKNPSTHRYRVNNSKSYHLFNQQYNIKFDFPPKISSN